MFRRSIGDTLLDVDDAVRWADEVASRQGASQATSYAIQVCLEEALANLILHARAANAYKDIVVDLKISSTDATITITDDCVPFDITRVSQSSRPSLQDMGVGGHGVRLLRSFAHGLTYQRKGERNELTMVVRPLDRA